MVANGGQALTGLLAKFQKSFVKGTAVKGIFCFVLGYFLLFVLFCPPISITNFYFKSKFN